MPRHDAVPGHLVVDEAEAELVRMLYGWLVDERMTIRQILKRLNAGPYFPRSGRHPWSPSVVHHILADPVYAGTAYANRYTFVPPRKPRRAVGPRSRRGLVPPAQAARAVDRHPRAGAGRAGDLGPGAGAAGAQRRALVPEQHASTTTCCAAC